MQPISKSKSAQRAGPSILHPGNSYQLSTLPQQSALQSTSAQALFLASEGGACIQNQDKENQEMSLCDALAKRDDLKVLTNCKVIQSNHQNRPMVDFSHNKKESLAGSLEDMA